MRTEPLDPFSAHTIAPGDAETALRLDPTRTALLVVDMLNDFCEPGGAMVLPGAERLYGPIAELVSATRAHGSAVVWVCDCHERDTDAEFRKRTPHCLAGTWGAEIVSALPAGDGEAIVLKRRFSGFFDTDLEQRLRDGGHDQLVVCGVVTNICVRSTVHDAFFRDFDVYVPADACAATGVREQQSTLYDVATHFGTVTDVASVLTALGRAG